MMIGSEQQTHIRARSGYAPVWYVADLPGHDGLKRVRFSKSDWGWTTERARAIPLSEYWQRRFMADRRRVNRQPRLEEL
jgi:hypothetical protein